MARMVLSTVLAWESVTRKSLIKVICDSVNNENIMKRKCFPGNIES